MTPSGLRAPVCLNATGRLLPIVRAETARRLAAQGVRQDRVAQHLGVTQAMVSKYLRAAGAPPEPRIARLVESSVARALQDEAAGHVGRWCAVCPSLADEGLAAAGSVDDHDECLRPDSDATPRGRAHVLSQLADAERALRHVSAEPLVPEVRCNLAMAAEGAKTLRDVAAFPGRLTLLHGRLRAAAPPEFGSSTHLADVLLKVRGQHPSITTILNVRADDAIVRAARRLGWTLQTLSSRGKKGATPHALHDPGAFGIEPALYLVGPTPRAVVAAAQQLLRQFTPRNGNRT